MSSRPFLDLTGHGNERLLVAETERGALAPGAGLILERTGEGRREEWGPVGEILTDWCSRCVSLR